MINIFKCLEQYLWCVATYVKWDKKEYTYRCLFMQKKKKKEKKHKKLMLSVACGKANRVARV